MTSSTVVGLRNCAIGLCAAYARDFTTTRARSSAVPPALSR